MAELGKWENFYIIIGSAAGALIGLQFVVMTLLSEVPLTSKEAEAGDAFGTPNVFHFSVVLLLSAIVSMPWRGLIVPEILLFATGIGGIIYTLRIAKRVHEQTVYKPVLEDWFSYIVSPILGYVLLAIAALFLTNEVYTGSLLAAIASLILLFAGIHNAWDLVTYHIFVRKQQGSDQRSR